ncbi:hypothetical protein Q0590_30385 [Rhodocytophaga aerolata]|uniref:Uncharacterized protein n=1 Tax=Rhodocytophaga aerolata TaxID=455078 RepID=A0ABT8REU0_9BACT|nr:hypothetical protein [Rhodocytophaga aerolata]MDO1450620.1 hypothetical protein [Rhodocytophaga aerolata]
MKKHILYAGLLLSIDLNAQSVSSGLDAQTNIDALGTDNLNGMVRKFDTRYEGVRGTPYLVNYWNNGTIVLKGGKKLSEVPVKVDLFGYEIISKRVSGDSIIVKAATIDKVMLTDVLTGQVHTFKKWADLGMAKAGYADIMYDGKYLLIADRKKTLVKANYQGGYSANRPYDEFIDEVSFFVKKPDQNLEKIKLSRKAILEVFPDHQAELKSFISKNQIDFREVSQVIKIFHFYDTL